MVSETIEHIPWHQGRMAQGNL